MNRTNLILTGVLLVSITLAIITVITLHKVNVATDDVINKSRRKYDSLQVIKDRAFITIDSLNNKIVLLDSVSKINNKERIKIIKIKDETNRIVRNYTLTQRDSFMSTIRIR